MSGAEQDKPDQSEKRWFVFFLNRLVIVCFFALSVCVVVAVGGGGGGGGGDGERHAACR